MSAATLPPRSQYFMKPFTPEEWDEIFAPLKEDMEEIHEVLQNPLPLFFKDEVEVDESSLRLLDSPVDTPPAVISIIAVPPKCSFPSGTLDITPHPNALSHEVGEGKYTWRGHDIQNAIMGIIDQSMCCPKNFPLCATEATLALSFPLHGPDQKTHCPPSTGQDLGRLLQTAHVLSFSKHGPDIWLLATSGEALLQFAKSFCMTPQPTRQTPGIRMAEGQTTYGRLRPVRRPWF